MSDYLAKLEMLPSVYCPECEGQLYVDSSKAIRKIRQGMEHSRDPETEKTYIITCGNHLCKEYRKVKFIKAHYLKVNYHDLED